ncbi:MAG: zinc dependent phospholipase C family protein [Bacilli bacterium]|nr:zinc dependent phospholipase C family protein [Bacilli bacterium]
MPATITHSYFAKDLYEVLPESISSKIDLNRTKMFSNSTDSILFYNLLSFKSGKSLRRFQKYFHTHRTNYFFINLLEYVKKNKIEDTDTYSFIVGFISHYVLDSTIHPYIVYKTGMFNKKDKSTYKYNGIHHFMEVFLDNDLVRRRENTDPYKFNMSKYCFDTKKKFSNELNDTIDYTFYTTFNVKNMSKKYYISLKQMKRILKLFRSDKYGIKKFFYKLLDTFTPRSLPRFEVLSYHYTLEDKHNYLNNNHTIWYNPCDNSISSTESYVDLYLKSLEEAKNIIIKVFCYLNGQDIDLNELFKNKSYITGLDCDKEKELKYFEF